MSGLYRGRFYTIEEIQQLTFNPKTLQNEFSIYNITPVMSDTQLNLDSEDIILTANVLLLLVIERYCNDFIEEKMLEFYYNKILTFVKNADLLGYQKVYKKLMIIADELHYGAFEVQL